MQFMTRSLVALGILTLTLALLALAGFQIISAMQERDARGSRQRPAEERVYAVNVDTLRLGTATPVKRRGGAIPSQKPWPKNAVPAPGANAG